MCIGKDMRPAHDCKGAPGHLKCPECQNSIRRDAKKNNSHYKTHGVCMTPESRVYWRKKKGV